MEHQHKLRKDSHYSGMFFGVVAAFIWGVFPVVTQLSIEQNLSPYDIAALRFLVAGPLLIPVLWRYKLNNVDFLSALLLVCGAGAPYLVLVIVGLNYAPAVHFGAITPSSMLIFTAIASWLWLGEKFTVNRIVGTVVIVSGILVLSWEALFEGSGSLWVGDMMFLAGGLLWAIYTVVLRKLTIEPLHAIALVSVISMVFYLPLYFIFSDRGIFSAPVSEVLFQAVFQGIFAVLIALLLYSKAVAILGAARGSLFGAMVPVIALLLAIPILDEYPTMFQMAGVALVTSGMLFALGFFSRK